MNRRFSEEELHAIRNRIPVRFVLKKFCGTECKEIEGSSRFVCPVCHEMRTSIHPNENLGRCFRCERNFNPIELVMLGCELSFVESVKLLQKHIKPQAARDSVDTSNSRLNIS